MDRKMDLVVERQWHVGMQALALREHGWLGRVFGGFPAQRYRAQGVPGKHLSTYPWPSITNHFSGKLGLADKIHLDESRLIADWVGSRRDLSPIVACYATAYRHLFPILQKRGRVLLLERGSTHPENYFFQIQKARADAGLSHQEVLPEDFQKEIRAGQLAHFIGAGSAMIAESYRERGHARERILTIPYCTNPGFFSYRNRAGGGSREIVAACVGVIGLRKGLGRLIQIARWAEARRLPLKIRLIGPLEAEAPELLAHAPDSLDWLGVKKGVALVEQLHAADLYLLPSYEEGFGISIIEAMSTGLPAIVSEETGGREAIRDGVNGVILSDYSPETLDEKLAPLFLNASLRTEMGRAARNTVESTYTPAQYQNTMAIEYGRMFAILDKEPVPTPAWRGPI